MMILITTAPGLEGALIEELESLGYEGEPSIGRVLLNVGYEEIPKINYFSAIAHRAFIVLKEFEIPTDTKERAFEIIKKELLEIPREERFDPSLPFAVRGERYPKEYPHPFTSVDLGIPGGSAIIERIMRKKGKRIPVNLKKPAYEVYLEVIKERVRVMINTTGESLHKRGYRIRGHPASLSTTIARFMVRLPNIDDVCDPMCGSGTILLEARLEKQGVPIGRIRSKTYGRLRRNLLPFRDVRLEDPGNERKDQRLTFGDRSSKHIDSAIANSINLSRLAEAPKGYRVYDLAKYRMRDFTQVDLSCDTIVTNPPYGLRLGDPKSVEPVYKKLFEVDRNELVLITPRDDLISKYAPEPRAVYKVMHGDLPVKIYYFK